MEFPDFLLTLPEGGCIRKRMRNPLDKGTKHGFGFTISLLALLSTSLFVFTAWGEDDPAPEPEIPWEVEVYREYCPELTYESYVADCWTGYADEELHIVAVTDTPTLVPAEMDLIPILTVAPPATSPAPLAALPQAVEVYRAVCPALVDEVYIEDCWTGYVDEALHIVVMTDTPALIPAQIGTIPTLTIAPPSDPPTEDDPDSSESDAPGFDTAQSGEPDPESAESDSSGTDQDTQGKEGSGANQPAIAGIPYAKAVEIFRHQNFLAVAGVMFVWLDANGIVVMTDQPDLIPATFEGLPVRTEPAGEFIFGMGAYGQP